jgi:hypothetical protein
MSDLPASLASTAEEGKFENMKVLRKYGAAAPTSLLPPSLLPFLPYFHPPWLLFLTSSLSLPFRLRFSGRATSKLLIVGKMFLSWLKVTLLGRREGGKGRRRERRREGGKVILTHKRRIRGTPSLGTIFFAKSVRAPNLRARGYQKRIFGGRRGPGRRKNKIRTP